MKRVLAALGLMISASGPALALDLKKAKFPIEYECRATHTAYLGMASGGGWSAGQTSSSRDPYRFMVEKYEVVQSKQNKESCEYSRMGNGGVALERQQGYCMSFIIDGRDENQPGISGFCVVTLASLAKKDNAVLECNRGTYVLDTDRGTLVTTSNLFPLGVPNVSVTKSDCVRLDR